VASEEPSGKWDWQRRQPADNFSAFSKKLLTVSVSNDEGGLDYLGTTEFTMQLEE